MIRSNSYERLDSPSRFSSVSHAIKDGCLNIWKKITGKLAGHEVRPAPEPNASQKLLDSYHAVSPEALWPEKVPVLTKLPHTVVGTAIYPPSSKTT